MQIFNYFERILSKASASISQAQGEGLWVTSQLGHFTLTFNSLGAPPSINNDPVICYMK